MSGPEMGEGAKPENSKPASEETPDGETTLVPKSMFPDGPPEVGATCKFHVKHIWDKEVELAYAGADEAPEKSGPSSMDEADDSIDKMATPADEGE